MVVLIHVLFDKLSLVRLALYLGCIAIIVPMAFKKFAFTFIPVLPLQQFSVCKVPIYMIFLRLAHIARL